MPVAVIGVVAAGGVLTNAVATADPALPARTAAELLVAIADAPDRPFSGTVAENADLGIPALPGSAASTSLSWQSLVTGSHTAHVWYAGPARQRVSLVGDLAESDVVRNGSDVWIWSSRDNTVSHGTLPARAELPRQTVPPIDPATAAKQALAALDPSTAVTVSGTSRVAGRPVYELVLAPRDAASLIGQVRLAVDSETSLPLRLQVIARGASDPAFETAFTSISFDRPADSVFAFTPPPGATVTEATLPTAVGAPHGERPSGSAVWTQPHPTVIGTGWTAVVEIPDGAAALQGLSGAGPNGAPSGSAAAATALLGATTPVSGAFGTGRMLTTSLVSVLILSDGRVLLGAVTPDRLEQVAASTTK